MHFNQFVDFKKLFSALIEENRQELNESKQESDTYRKILEFLETDYKKFELDLDECDFDDKYVFFIFSYYFDDANESNTQSSYADYTIKFDRMLDEFTLCEYEAG